METNERRTAIIRKEIFWTFWVVGMGIKERLRVSVTPW